MTTAKSSDFGAKPTSRFNGALCPVCQRQFRDGEIVCPVDLELLVPAVIDPLIGTVIERKYRLVSLSGKGAQARVYRATHETIGRTVAVKIIEAPTDVASTRAVERLKREARALSLVNHPNVPRLFDAGELPDGSAYLVQEFYEGSSLSDQITAQTFMTADVLAPIIFQICDALDHIHSHGLVHRDIKPENILILNKPQGRITAKLIDFGVCKYDDPNEDQGGASAEICGSPLYMSPENINSMLVDKRSDIYSLGATMYHALAGKPPLSETNLVDIVHAHRSVMPAPISYVAPKAGVPLPVEAAVFRALQKLPSNRYQSAAEMKAALQKALAPDSYTGRMSNLEFSGAELRALVAFVKAAALEPVQKLLEQTDETTAAIKLALMSKLRRAIDKIETTQSPSGELLEELAMENTQIGESAAKKLGG